LAEIAAAMQRINPEVCFVVIGDGIESAQIEQRARAIGILEQNFFMLPRVSKQEITRFFAAAAVTLSFVVDVPELWANSANKVFDGFASGKCVAINHQGWQADLLVTSGAGFVLPPADADVAAALLAQVLANPHYVQRAGQAALRLAQTQFDRDLLANQLEQVLIQVVQNHSAG
jgi:glycosyltransferase involved in cell wall biosynthesis